MEVRKNSDYLLTCFTLMNITEGAKAFQRLQLEILQKYPDESIFAWPPEVKGPHRILATSPDNFASCADLGPQWQDVSSKSLDPDPRRSNPPRVTS